MPFTAGAKMTLETGRTNAEPAVEEPSPVVGHRRRSTSPPASDAVCTRPEDVAAAVTKEQQKKQRKMQMTPPAGRVDIEPDNHDDHEEEYR